MFKITAEGMFWFNLMMLCWDLYWVIVCAIFEKVWGVIVMVVFVITHCFFVSYHIHELEAEE